MALLLEIPDSPAYLNQLRSKFLGNIPLQQDFMWNSFPTLKKHGLVSSESHDDTASFKLGYELDDLLAQKVKSARPVSKILPERDEKIHKRFSTHKRYTNYPVSMEELLKVITPDRTIPGHILATLICHVDPRMASPASALSTNRQDNYLPITGRDGKVTFCRLLYNTVAQGPRWNLFLCEDTLEQIPSGKVIIFGDTHV